MIDHDLAPAQCAPEGIPLINISARLNNALTNHSVPSTISDFWQNSGMAMSMVFKPGFPTLEGVTASLFLLLLLGLSLHLNPAEAQEFTPVEVIPAAPIQGEPIVIHYRLVGCSAPSDHDGIDMNIDGWIISVDFIPQEVCIPFTREFDVSVPGLPAGQYQLMTYVNYTATSFPVDPDERTLLYTIDFEVSGHQAVSVDSLGSWGKTILALVFLLTVSLVGLYEKRSIQAC